MKIFYTHPFRTFFLFLPLLLLGSCGLKPISSEYNLLAPGVEKIKTEDLGNGKILIYNGADWKHTIDNTARLNIWIDNKSLGQLRPGEYVVVQLPPGQYNFIALHRDVVNMKSEHEVLLDEESRIIEIKPTITSNKLTVRSVLPKNFEEFTYMEATPPTPATL